MFDSIGVVLLDSTTGVGCVGTELVSDSEVESSMSDGQTSTECKACASDEQQYSWSELTRSLKHLLIYGLVTCAESILMT